MDILRVTVLPENATVTVNKGTNLLNAARMAGIEVISPCGGAGTCGKCAVKVLSGEYELSDGGSFPEKLREEGYISACQATAVTDLVIEVPDFSRLLRHEVVLSSKDTRLGIGYGHAGDIVREPVSRKYLVKLDAPTLLDNLNDLDRLKLALKREHGIDCQVTGTGCMAVLPDIVRKGDWSVTVTVAEINGVTEIIRVEAGNSIKPAIGLAVDLGTTTVAARLVDLAKGTVLDQAGTYNKQCAYGSDVISRICYTEDNPEGIKSMQQAAVDTINELAVALAAQNGLDRDDISAMAVGGNTVMIHLLLGITASWLRREPYVPCAVKFPDVKAGRYGFAINPEAPVVTMPSVASYVGGDVTAGVLATRLARSEELVLFADIGTNGEMVLGNNDWMVACSCSAGPAFEGSGISCGLRAMDGAIDRIEIDEATYDVSCRTIGNIKPLGICGSGLIYSLSEMMRAGIIDRAGQINGSILSRRIRRGNEGLEYVLVFAGESGSSRDIVITDSDIKNLLRAKGAIFAGIRTMLKEVRLDFEDISKVYIAGGFGNYINITDAMNIGMFPAIPEDRYEYVGNSCIQGTMLAMVNREAYREVHDIADNMTCLELSLGSTFMEEFVQAMFIPHTDMELFKRKR